MEVCGEALRTCAGRCAASAAMTDTMFELRAQASARLADAGTASYRDVTARRRKRRRRNRQREKRSNAECRDIQRRAGGETASGRLDRKDGCLSGRFAHALRSLSVRAAGGWGLQRRTHGRRKSARFQGLTRAPRAGGRIATREPDALSQIVGTQHQGIRVELDPFLRAEGKDEKTRFVAGQLLIAAPVIGGGFRRRLVLSDSQLTR